MARIINERKRGLNNKNRYAAVVMAVEGTTEKLYFNNFKRRTLNLKFCPGNDTDPISMVNNLINYVETNKLNSETSDKIYCILDSDTDENKQTQINEALAIAEANNILLILSIPSFELWYLLHFDYYSTTSLQNKELIKELKKPGRIPDYKKALDVYQILTANTKGAIAKCKRLNKHHLSLGENIHSIKSNPSTQVYRVVEYLLSLDKK